MSELYLLKPNSELLCDYTVMDLGRFGMALSRDVEGVNCRLPSADPTRCELHTPQASAFSLQTTETESFAAKSLPYQTLHCAPQDLTLMDWGARNLVAVALHNEVYLWNATSGTIQHLMQLEAAEDYLSSVAWIKEGNVLAVGNSQGLVQVLEFQRQHRTQNQVVVEAGVKRGVSWSIWGGEQFFLNFFFQGT